MKNDARLFYLDTANYLGAQKIAKLDCMKRAISACCRGDGHISWFDIDNLFEDLQFSSTTIPRIINNVNVRLAFRCYRRSSTVFRSLPAKFCILLQKERAPYSGEVAFGQNTHLLFFQKPLGRSSSLFRAMLIHEMVHAELERRGIRTHNHPIIYRKLLRKAYSDILKVKFKLPTKTEVRKHGFRKMGEGAHVLTHLAYLEFRKLKSR